MTRLYLILTSETEMELQSAIGPRVVPVRARSTIRRKLSDAVVYGSIQALRLLSTLVPESLVRPLAHVLGDFVFFVVQWRRHVVTQRIAAAFPSMSQVDQRRLARAAYTHLAHSLLWFLRLPSIIHNEGLDGILRRVEIDSETHKQLAQLRHDLYPSCAQPQIGGAVVTTGHIGVWELLSFVLASPILPQHAQWIVYRPLHNESMDKLTHSLRGGADRHLIQDKDCFDLLASMLRSPHSGLPSIVGLVADHRSSNPMSQSHVQFLGQPTRFPTGAARLHQSTGAPLWFAAIVFNAEMIEDGSEPTQPFRLILHEISETNDRSSTEEYARILDETVRRHPSQYLWMHNLWAHKAAQLFADEHE